MLPPKRRVRVVHRSQRIAGLSVSRAPADPTREVAHRPWPIPDEPWIIRQEWSELLFAHWPLPPDMVRSYVPKPLALDTFADDAWVGVVPFYLRELKGRYLPPVPGATAFPELNLRTYVRYGDKPGVWFFSLDAASTLAVAGARALFGLPYHRAEMESSRRGRWIRYESRRRGGSAVFIGRYRPVGDDPRPAPEGSLDRWLVERYCLYTVANSGRPRRVEIHHPAWRLRPAEAEIEVNTIARAEGLELPGSEPLLHFAEPQPVLTWFPAPA